MSDNKKIHLKRYKKCPPGISYWDFLSDAEIVEDKLNINVNRRI